MGTEQDLHEELVSLYRRTGEAIGYWPSYFLRSVRAEGGLTVAKSLLAPGRESTGFDRLVEARRADLSVEAIAISDRYSHLFTPAELHEAEQRLSGLPKSAFPKTLSSPPATIGEVVDGKKFEEGAVKRVPVNQYERNPKARAACIRQHGVGCAVCGFDFEERYGEIGEGFIHVHHKRPLGRLKSTYRLDPKNDLVPVCPNCHAMLHRRDPPFDVEQLRARLSSGQRDDQREA